MISDSELNSLAVFLGTFMMGLIVLYHFLAVNSLDKSVSASVELSADGSTSAVAAHSRGSAVVGK